MKNLLFSLVLIILLSAGNQLWSQKSPVKSADLSEFTLNGTRSQQIFGQHNEQTPVFSRATEPGYDGTCQTSDGIYSEDFKYTVYTIQANSDGLLVLTLDRTNEEIYCVGDMFVYCYCSPFDPENPEVNYYAHNDDGGLLYNSAFTPDDNIQLEAGQFYDIVCTHWCPYDGYGLPLDYVLTIDSDVTIQGAPIETPVSSWALGIGIFLILTIAVIRMKRFIS